MKNRETKNSETKNSETEQNVKRKTVKQKSSETKNIQAKHSEKKITVKQKTVKQKTVKQTNKTTVICCFFSLFSSQVASDDVVISFFSLSKCELKPMEPFMPRKLQQFKNVGLPFI